MGTRLEEVRAERELRDNQGRSALARAALTAAQEALGAVAGAGEPLDADTPPALPALPRLAAALAELKDRPDVAALTRDVQISQRAVDDGWLDYLPTLGLTAQPYLQTPSTATQPERGWQAQLALVVPLFDGGLRGAAQRDRRAQLTEAQAALAERAAGGRRHPARDRRRAGPPGAGPAGHRRPRPRWRTSRCSWPARRSARASAPRSI